MFGRFLNAAPLPLATHTHCTHGAARRRARPEAPAMEGVEHAQLGASLPAHGLTGNTLRFDLASGGQSALRGAAAGRTRRRGATFGSGGVRLFAEAVLERQAVKIPPPGLEPGSLG